MNPLQGGSSLVFWLIALCYLLLRAAITIATWWLLAGFNGMTRRRAMMLGLALAAMPDNPAMLLGLGLVTLGINTPNFMHTVTLLYVISTVLAPIVTRLALIYAGETKPEERR